MSQQHDGQNVLASDPQQVLVDYLDQLLNESPAEPVVTAKNIAPAIEAATEVAVTEVNTVAEVAEPAAMVVDEPVVETPPVAEAEMAPAMAVPGAPGWAQQAFQVLLFKVSGLTLAVPLESLNGILEWNSDSVTEMPGHAEYFMGLLPEREQQIKVVDTASIVVPSKFRQGHSRDNLQKIILIGDGEWGLACDSVEEVIDLTPADVRWRSNEGLRAWLAGTVIEQMCALLDMEKFVDLLTSEQLQVAD